MKKNWKSRLAALGLAALSACSPQPKDNPIQGRVTIAADESLQPVIESIRRAYEGIYPDTKFDTLYRPEQQAVAAMLRDSARLVFATRELNASEVAVLAKEKIKVRTQVIATDAIALIVGKNNTDSLITMPELSGLFQGTITSWSQLKGSNQSGPVVLVFDNSNSSNLNFMLQKFGVQDVSKLRLYAVNSNRAVIDYVRTNPTALGFIGVNWISDGDEPLTRELSKDLRVMGVATKAAPSAISEYKQPFQANLAMQVYPLRRKVYVHSREVHSGLGGGLMTYIMRGEGSLLIEKSGLWPSVPYNRQVILNKN